MTQDEKRKIEHFFKNVLLCLNIHEWSLRWVPDSREGFCWLRRKVIDLGEDVYDKKHLLLHEIAHISTCRFCNAKHTKEFWKLYDDLRRRFLPGDDSPSQISHKKVQYKSFYKLVYAQHKEEK